MKTKPKTFGSLFAGIGGFDLGLERCGLVCKWQVEIDPFCRQVLAKHWPSVPRHDDVATFPPGDWTDEALAVDLICAGWPCQDISISGKGAGLNGSRSRLFFDAVRVARQLKARWLFLENVPALFSNGMGHVLKTLAESGFNARWQMLSAQAVGAPHKRDRVFILATAANCNGQRKPQPQGGQPESGQWARNRSKTTLGTRDLSNANNADGAHGGQARRLGRQQKQGNDCTPAAQSSHWAGKPEFRRVADGIPDGLDSISLIVGKRSRDRKARLMALGNAVVPQCVEYLARQWGWAK